MPTHQAGRPGAVPESAGDARQQPIGNAEQVARMHDLHTIDEQIAPAVQKGSTGVVSFDPG